ncbi:MAG: PrpR N-terminal domain-containing protein [Lachnospiraceae bacterium]|nr:PrpR N-terminal domain-containing protein [Lachnospiraceae bacterium]
MEKVKILGIAPYPNLKSVMDRVAANYPNIEFVSHVGDLEAGVDIVHNLQHEGFDAIISRGGTARLISQAVSIPVIEIDIFIYDLLRAIRLAENFHGKFAIVGFHAFTQKANIITDLLQISIDVITIRSAEEAESSLTDMLNNGYYHVVCDNITSVIAKRLGITAVLVTSGQESVEAAFSQATSIVETNIAMRRENILLTILANKNPSQVFLVDSHGNAIQAMNSLKIPTGLRNILLKRCRSISNQLDTSFYERYNKQLFLIKSVPVSLKQDRYIAFYVTAIDNFKNLYHSVSLNQSELTSDDVISNFLNSYYSAGPVRNLLSEYAHVSSPILIAGEIGTGKDTAARCIYKNSSSNKRNFWIIDCSTLSEKDCVALTSNISSPLNDDQSTLYFKNIESLSQTSLHRLKYFFDISHIEKRCKLIFSYQVDSVNNLHSDVFQELSRLLNVLLLYLPSLNEREDDLPGIASLYINKFNSLYGKQIIGFEPDALELLQSFHWYHNLIQMERIINELVVMSPRSFIQKRDLSLLLKKETHQATTVQNASILYSPGKTLREIEYDLVTRILQEENNKKAQTAQRLGISRSTLWRILKEGSGETQS